MYAPLPNNIKLLPSPIHGYGLFASCDINKGMLLGISHISNEHFPNGWIRTPLGGFYNHSETPNCILHETTVNGMIVKILKTLTDVKINTELTCTYTIWEATPEMKQSKLTWLGL